MRSERVINGGGWTLVLVSSSDGVETWTWNNQTLWTTNQTPVGTLEALNEDFKSPAYHTTKYRDIAFIHQPSGVWAVYNDV